jgi:hypothetical protein
MKMNRTMKWNLIFLLSLSGIMMGFGSVYGLVQDIEWILWILIGAVSAAILARYVKKRHFSHGFLLGLFNTILASSIQVIFFKEFLANNSRFAERLESLSVTIEDRMLYLLFAPMAGVVSGLVLGVMTFAAAKFISVTSEQNNVSKS